MKMMKRLHFPVFTDFIDPVDNCDPRRRQELADSRMIQEDMHSMSNLPGKPVYHEFNAWKYKEHFAGYNQNNSKWEKNRG